MKNKFDSVVKEADSMGIVVRTTVFGYIQFAFEGRVTSMVREGATWIGTDGIRMTRGSKVKVADWCLSAVVDPY